MKKNKVALTVATTVMLLGSGSFALAQPTVNADAPQATFNIAKCGAKANDPNFDNGPIISQLIDKLPATGGIIKIPAGTYYIKTPIKVDKSFVTIEGVNDGWRSGIDPANSNGKESGGSHIELANKNMDGIDVHSADSHRLSGDEFRDLNIEGQSSTGVGINVQSDNDHTVIQGTSMKNLGTDIINKGADCTRIVDNQLAESRNNIAMTGASQQAEIEHNQLGAQPGGISVMMENPSNYAVNSNLIYPDGTSNITLYNPSHGTVWGNTLSSYTTGLINVLPNAQGNKGNANVIASNQVTINAYHKNGYATNGLPATLNWGAIHDENYRDLINHNVVEMNTPSGTAGIVMNSSRGTRAQDNLVTNNNTAAVNNTVPSPAAPTVSADAGNSGTTSSSTTQPTNSSSVSPAAKPSATQPTKPTPTTSTSTTKPAVTTSSATKPTVSSSSEPTAITGTESSSTVGNVIPTNPAASSSTTNKPSASSQGVTKPATTKPASNSNSQDKPSGSTSSGNVTPPANSSGSSVAPTGNGNTIPVNTDKPAANHSNPTVNSHPSATTSSDTTNSNSGSTSASGTSSTNEPSAIPVTGGGSTDSDTGSSTGSSSLPIGGGTTATTDHATPSDTPVVQPSGNDTPSTNANNSSMNVSDTPSVTTPDTGSSVTDGNTIPDNPLSSQLTNGGGTTATTASVKPSSDPNGIVDTGNAISASSSGKREQAKTSSAEATTKPMVKSSSVKATTEHSSAKSLSKHSGSSSLTPAEKDRSFLMSQVEAGNRNKDKDAMMSQRSSSMESFSSRTSVKTSKKHSHESSMMNQQSSSLVTNNGANGGANANATGNSNGTPAFAQTGGTTKVSHNWLYNLIYGLFNKSTK